ncbi:MAG TPA: phosphatase PAP2 family protein [Nitrospiraceae bacterium]|nr:phosphatase PAP2 family protein [Nitrospiraceae bacterium]
MLSAILLIIILNGVWSHSGYAGAPAATTLCPTDHVEEGREPRGEKQNKDGPIDEALGTAGSLGRAFFKDLEFVVTSPLRLDPKSGLLLGGVAAGIGGLTLLDDEIQTVFQKNRDHSKDDIAASLETLGFAQSVLIGNVALIGTGWLFREREAGNKLMQTALLSLEAQLFAEGIAGMTKFSVGRNRPNEGQGSDSFKPFHEFDRSFPSSHAARTFAVAAVFADRYEQPIPFIAYTAATLISVDRIYVNEHFASDVFAGAVLGFALGKVLSWRHRDEDQGWTVLPFAPDGRGGLGLTFTSAF